MVTKRVIRTTDSETTDINVEIKKISNGFILKEKHYIGRNEQYFSDLLSLQLYLIGEINNLVDGNI